MGQFHPDRLRKMVVINVPHPIVMRSELKSSWEQIKNSWYIFFFQLPFLPESKIPKCVLLLHHIGSRLTSCQKEQLRVASRSVLHVTSRDVLKGHD